MFIFSWVYLEQVGRCLVQVFSGSFAGCKMCDLIWKHDFGLWFAISRPFSPTWSHWKLYEIETIKVNHSTFVIRYASINLWLHPPDGEKEEINTPVIHKKDLKEVTFMTMASLMPKRLHKRTSCSILAGAKMGGEMIPFCGKAPGNIGKQIWKNRKKEKQEQ